MNPQLTYITLGVADLDQAIRFYDEAFSLTPSKRHADFAYFQLGSVRLALHRHDQLAALTNAPVHSGATNGVLLSQNVATRGEVDMVVERATKAGAHVTREAHDTTWSGRSAFLRDPDGHIWEIAWNPLPQTSSQKDRTSNGSAS